MDFQNVFILPFPIQKEMRCQIPRKSTFALLKAILSRYIQKVKNQIKKFKSRTLKNTIAKLYSLRLNLS
jgi:hypothetical protein